MHTLTSTLNEKLTFILSGKSDNAMYLPEIKTLKGIYQSKKIIVIKKILDHLA